VLLVTADEMRALDREVIERLGVPGVVLMESAGRGVVDVIAARLDVPRSRFAVFCGPGNNGGDGFVVARHLANRGAQAHVVLCVPEERVTGDARVHYLACRGSNVVFHDAATDAQLRAALPALAGADCVVDALLGTGLQRAVAGHLAGAIAAINEHAGLVVAVDVPSGLDADRGVPLGACVRAAHTVTFGFAKLGLVGAPGFTYAGCLHVADIGIPERLARQKGVTAELLAPSVLEPLRRPRAPLSHKGTHGHVLLWAGSRGKLGAAVLAGSAVLRAGAGLCTVALERTLQPSFDGRVPELMSAGYASADEGAPPSDEEAGTEAAGELCALVSGKRVVAAGPGMPVAPVYGDVLARVIAGALAARAGVVLDADALNHVARDPQILAARAEPGRVILTPHPGEAARLLGRGTDEVQGDRVGAARALAARFSAVVALKGARTVVAAPDGRLAVCPTGNPGLGSGGTGDVLLGCVAALFAEEPEPFSACARAVYLHGAAGDLAAATHGERGLIAHDVVDALPRVLGS
jgi:NAD(P)H-hydrate epimerase